MGRGIFRRRTLREPVPDSRSMTPASLERWKVLAARQGRRALGVARTHADDQSPFRRVERYVVVTLRLGPHLPEIALERLELECGHVVPMPGGALHYRPRLGDWRRCRECA